LKKLIEKLKFLSETGFIKVPLLKTSDNDVRDYMLICRQMNTWDLLMMIHQLEIGTLTNIATNIAKWKTDWFGIDYMYKEYLSQK